MVWVKSGKDAELHSLLQTHLDGTFVDSLPGDRWHQCITLVPLLWHIWRKREASPTPRAPSAGFVSTLSCSASAPECHPWGHSEGGAQSQSQGTTPSTPASVRSWWLGTLQPQGGRDALSLLKRNALSCIPAPASPRLTSPFRVPELRVLRRRGWMTRQHPRHLQLGVLYISAFRSQDPIAGFLSHATTSLRFQFSRWRTELQARF